MTRFSAIAAIAMTRNPSGFAGSVSLMVVENLSSTTG
jgi:hypothetical protein